MYKKVAIIPLKITARYALIMPQTASGALRKTRIKSRQAKARIFRNMGAIIKSQDPILF